MLAYQPQKREHNPSLLHKYAVYSCSEPKGLTATSMTCYSVHYM